MFWFKVVLLSAFCLLQLQQASSEYDTYRLYSTLNSSLGHFITVTYYPSPDEKYLLNDYFKNQHILVEEDRNNVVIVHGWNDYDSESHWMEELKNKVFAHNPNVNVFLVDWREQSNSIRPSSAAWYAHTVTQDLHSFLNVLVESNTIQKDRLHLIGKGIGAHVCGLVGHRFSEDNFKIARITALDPFGPNFVSSYNGRKLSAEDATRVVTFHTSMGNDILDEQKKPQLPGHLNLFVNGGVHQPACNYMLEKTSHDKMFGVEDKNNRVIHVRDVTDPALLKQTKVLTSKSSKSSGYSLTEFLFCDHNQIDNYLKERQNDDKCQMVAYQCESYQKFQQGKCSSCGVNGRRCFVLDLESHLLPNPAIKVLRDEAESSSGETFVASVHEMTPPALESTSYFVDTHHEGPYCVNHYQLTFTLDALSGENNGRIVIDLYNATESVFRTFEVQGDFKPKQKYTYLIKTRGALDPFVKATASYQNLWTNYLKTGKRLHMKTFSLKYMSHIDYSQRLKRSTKLCFNSFVNGKNYLSKCPLFASIDD